MKLKALIFLTAFANNKDEIKIAATRLRNLLHITGAEEFIEI